MSLSDPRAAGRGLSWPLEEGRDYLGEQDVLVEKDLALGNLPARGAIAAQDVVAGADEPHLFVTQVVHVDEEVAVDFYLIVADLQDAHVGNDVPDAREGLFRPMDA